MNEEEKKSEPKKNSSDLLGMITGRIGKIAALIMALTVLLGAAEKFFKISSKFLAIVTTAPGVVERQPDRSPLRQGLADQRQDKGGTDEEAQRQTEERAREQQKLKEANRIAEMERQERLKLQREMEELRRSQEQEQEGAAAKEQAASNDVLDTLEVPVNNTQTPRRKYHEIGVTHSGEPVVQTPMPGQERAGEEIQLQIVMANGNYWSSKVTPWWGGSCDGTLRRIGNNTGYTYRFYALRQGECQITLSAIGDREGILWDETYYIQVRK